MIYIIFLNFVFSGADNRDDAEGVPPPLEDTESDSSDSDTPLALYAHKMKKI